MRSLIDPFVRTLFHDFDVIVTSYTLKITRAIIWFSFFFFLRLACKVSVVLGYQLGVTVMGLQKFICLRKVRRSSGGKNRELPRIRLARVVNTSPSRKQLCDTSAPGVSFKVSRVILKCTGSTATTPGVPHDFGSLWEIGSRGGRRDGGGERVQRGT